VSARTIGSRDGGERRRDSSTSRPPAPSKSRRGCSSYRAARPGWRCNTSRRVNNDGRRVPRASGVRAWPSSRRRSRPEAIPCDATHYPPYGTHPVPRSNWRRKSSPRSGRLCRRRARRVSRIRPWVCRALHRVSRVRESTGRPLRQPSWIPREQPVRRPPSEHRDTIGCPARLSMRFHASRIAARHNNCLQ
jgi:hypothetical protein